MINSGMMFALAYIGPGLGAGIVATVLGVIASVFLAIFAVVWYPAKRLARRLRGTGTTQETEAAPAGGPDES